MELKIDKKWIDDAVQQAVDEVKKNYILIPKRGMTNGEVMKAVFPNLFIDFCVCDSVFLHSKEGSHLVDLVGRLERDFWDSPYKGVSE